MVATSLPFWMPRPSRSMVPFLADDTVGAQHRAPGGATAPSARARAIVRPTGRLAIERCGSADIEAHAAAWASLAARALEPNVFMEPGFALPALRHTVPALRPAFLLCWDHTDAGPRLVGLLALQPRRWPDLVPAAMAWHHPQGVTSAPLLDRDDAAAAFDALLAAVLAGPRQRGGLMLRGIPLDGALMSLIRRGSCMGDVLARRTRAVLRRPEADAPATGLSAKRAKEMRRQSRRLADGGACILRSAQGVDEVRLATERFLDLEARGWKGARGTAMLRSPRLATFTRTMTRLMARQGLCRIDTLEVGGEAVAIGIVLRSGDRAFFWKTAYDETRARLSPGKQLAAALGALQQADAGVALTDSCAIPDHPMIDTLWKDRMEVGDVLVAHAHAGWLSRAVASAGLRLAQTARQAVKSAFHAAKARLGRA